MKDDRVPGFANSCALTTSGLLKIICKCIEINNNNIVFSEPYERVRPSCGRGGGLDNLWHRLELKNGFDAGSSYGDGGLGVGVFHELSHTAELLIWAEGRDYFIISVL